jgi:hypothetical protein
MESPPKTSYGAYGAAGGRNRKEWKMGLADKILTKYSAEIKGDKINSNLNKERVKSLIGRKLHE